MAPHCEYHRFGNVSILHTLSSSAVYETTIRKGTSDNELTLTCYAEILPWITGQALLAQQRFHVVPTRCHLVAADGGTAGYLGLGQSRLRRRRRGLERATGVGRVVRRLRRRLVQ